MRTLVFQLLGFLLIIAFLIFGSMVLLHIDYYDNHPLMFYIIWLVISILSVSMIITIYLSYFKDE